MSRLQLALAVIAVVLAAGAAVLAGTSPSFGLDNHAVYEAF